MSQMLPPGPWRWERVVPDVPPGFPTQTHVQGKALVAADGTWLVWAESGYGSPDVHPAVKDLLADAWRLQDRDSRVGTGPVCPGCGQGALLQEVSAEAAAQDEDGSRVAVVKNVPRVRCAVCGHHELAPDIAERVDGLLASALSRNQVTVFDWTKVAPT